MHRWDASMLVAYLLQATGFGCSFGFPEMELGIDLEPDEAEPYQLGSKNLQSCLPRDEVNAVNARFDLAEILNIFRLPQIF